MDFNSHLTNVFSKVGRQNSKMSIKVVVAVLAVNARLLTLAMN
jgi:hypothetical protein